MSNIIRIKSTEGYLLECNSQDSNINISRSSIVYLIIATPISASRPQWVRNVPLTSMDVKYNFPAPEKSLDIASGFNDAKVWDHHPGIFIRVYARYITEV